MCILSVPFKEDIHHAINEILPGGNLLIEGYQPGIRDRGARRKRNDHVGIVPPGRQRSDSDPLRQPCLDDIVLFARTVFRDKLTLDGKGAAEMKEFQEQLLRDALKYHRYLSLFPAGHGKTTLLAVIVTIYLLCKFPNLRVIIVASDEDHAKNILSEIKGEFEGNDLLKGWFGEFYNKDKWAATSITIKQRRRNLKDPSIRAMGIRGAKQGPRADVVIFEDVADPKNSENESGQQMIERTLKYTVEKWMDRPDDFRIIATGTRVCFGDIYQSIQLLSEIQNRAGSRTLKRDRWVVKTAQACDANFENILWPEKFSQEFLMGERDRDPNTFDQRRRNIVRSEELLTFSEEAVTRSFDYSRSLGEIPPECKVRMGIDLASGSTKRGTAYSAIVVVGVDPLGRRHLIDLWRGKQTADKVVENAVSMYHAYNCGEARVEKNYQQGIIDILDILSAREGLVLHRHYTGRNKTKPEEGVPSLAPIFSAGNFTLPYKEESDRRKVEPLVAELRNFPAPGLTYDLLMALWIADLSVRSGGTTATVKKMSLPWYARRGA